MLKFLGTGSAFNTRLGNTSAYIKRGKVLFLIDCGSTVFSRMLSKDLLDDVEEIKVLITHMHPDHVGSLGDLILYSYFGMGEIQKPRVTLFYPFSLMMQEFLGIQGIEHTMYYDRSFDAKGTLIHVDGLQMNVTPHTVDHAPELAWRSYAYSIITEEGGIYYSGDTSMIPDEVMDHLMNGTYQAFYQDTSSKPQEGNVHLSIDTLDKLIPIEYRSIVHCMHHDTRSHWKKIRELGFNIATSEI